MTPPIITISKREFKAKYGNAAGVPAREGIIFFGKPSTKTHLHETYHFNNKHYDLEGKMCYITELIDIELDAETYAYQKMGKEVNYRIALSCLLSLIRLYDCGLHDAFNLILQALEDREIYPNREERHKLWWLGRTGAYPSEKREREGLHQLLPQNREKLK